MAVQPFGQEPRCRAELEHPALGLQRRGVISSFPPTELSPFQPGYLQNTPFVKSKVGVQCDKAVQSIHSPGRMKQHFMNCLNKSPLVLINVSLSLLLLLVRGF